MQRLFYNRYFQIIAGLIILFILLNFIIPEKYLLSPVRNLFIKISSPLTKAMNDGGESTNGFFYNLANIKSLTNKNEELEKKIAELTIENSKLKEAEKENEILREQLELKEEHKELELIAVTVIGRGPSNVSSKLIIDKGRNDEIVEGMPVVSGNFLVGKIDEVDADFSKVLLIVDPRSVVNVMVQESRAKGILKGEAGFNLMVESIPQEVELKKGQKVITSGLGGTFPKGLIVGEIEKIVSPESDVFQSASIHPAADFNHLEILFVVK